MDKFYVSKEWLKLRDRALIRDKYACQVNKRYKLLLEQATVVHHVLPREIFPEYELCLWNLISVKDTHTHNMLHIRGTCLLSKIGYEFLLKVIRKNNLNYEKIVKKYTEYKNKINPPSK